eukprot:CAMPEP_0172383664 /NCGR_PEP_ID=MMETSP1061-20121228/1523_1 /TAXON_ID=37318 /ORGANISM="Pseudo-nitzschia pungens, Strain cf. pungens" /LENGTH=786 /DNA_ID=CAMNT_0013111989 /DNA_START=203 /DNA_END=2563 /DNA_ORIENTATION=+
MDKPTPPEHENDLGTTSVIVSQNNSSKAASITDTKRSPDRCPAQSNGISSDPTAPAPLKANRQQQRAPTQSQSQSQNSTSAPAADVGKKSKQKLRKGKWTIEEEEYTSRIIQYFSTGLLTLPDGATLRSYLAEKLNCDPMRITKKFTGACCLGRRAYHLRDRPRASPAEVEMASFELMHLEQRFRLRVEHEQTGLPLPPRHELLASQPPPTASAVIPSLFSFQQGSAFKAANPWIQNQMIAPSPGQASLLPGPTGIIPNAGVPSPASNLAATHPSILLGQILLQNPAERTQASNPSSTPIAAAAPDPLQVLNNLVASYAISQAITQQQAGLAVLRPPGSNTSPRNNGTLGAITSNSAPPSRTFNFNVPDIAANVTRTSPPIPMEQRSEQVQLYRQQQQQQQQQLPQKKPQQPESNKTIPSTAALSRKEERKKKLKAAFEEQQRALRLAFEKSLEDAKDWEDDQQELASSTANLNPANATTSAASASKNSNALLENVSPAEQLQRSYEAHLASLQKAEEQSMKKISSKPSSPVLSPSEPAARIEAGGNKTDEPKTKEKRESSQKKTSDEEAAVILLGVLNSIRGLRESYEDAVEAKVGDNKMTNKSNEENKNIPASIPGTQLISSARQESSKETAEVSSDSSNRDGERKKRKDHDLSHKAINGRRQTSDPITSLSHFQSSKRKVKPASVTETSSSTSSQPTIEQSSSSLEDSKSDKSSSDYTDESEKASDESEGKLSVSIRASKGPPRKRLKGFHEPHEFTRENLMAHSKRMDMECGVSGDASSSEE